MRYFLFVAVLVLTPRLVIAAEPSPAPATGSHAAECQAAMDRIDDLASNPTMNVSLSTNVAARLAQGLALCRTGRTAEGAVLTRRALRALRASDTAQGYFSGR